MGPELSERQDAVRGDADLDALLREYVGVTDRLQRTHEALQGEIVRLREELASKDRELELRRRLAALGELAAGVAHEVRNPLGAIQLYSGLLRNQCSQHQLGPALQLIEKIDAGIHAIEGVVQDTLALAPRAGKARTCRLADVLERARETSLKTRTLHEVDLVVSGMPDDVRVRVDERGLERVLVNLIVNGAEASEVGSVVHIHVTVNDESVELHVQDEGCGLPDEVLHRIFDPFFTTKKQGTGLGLTIAHRLIEAYGGELHARNRDAGGAEFVVVLPVACGADADDESQRDARDFTAA